MRLFFALWPDEQTLAQLIAAQRLIPNLGRAVTPANMHLTLNFLGEINSTDSLKIREAASNISLQPFELEFGIFGYFSKPEILWLGPRAIPDELILLQKRIAKISTARLQTSREKFKPHISLYRRYPPTAFEYPAIEPFAWRVDSFSLVESHRLKDGVQYEVLHDYY